MSTISRRNIALGAAWAVPVIAVGSAAPMVSASPVVTIDAVGECCKFPGQSWEGFEFGYKVVLTLHAIVTTQVNIDKITFNGNVFQVVGQSLFTVDSNTVVTVTIGSDNSANGTALVEFSTPDFADVAPVSFPSFHPCDR